MRRPPVRASRSQQRRGQARGGQWRACASVLYHARQPVRERRSSSRTAVRSCVAHSASDASARANGRRVAREPATLRPGSHRFRVTVSASADSAGPCLPAWPVFWVTLSASGSARSSASASADVGAVASDSAAADVAGCGTGSAVWAGSPRRSWMRAADLRLADARRTGLSRLPGRCRSPRTVLEPRARPLPSGHRRHRSRRPGAQVRRSSCCLRRLARCGRTLP